MISTPSMQELLEAGVHFGHQVRRGNPRMKQYIYGAREGVHILDLAKSEELLKAACEYVYQLGKSGKVLLFVGTKKQVKDIVKESAKSASAPYLAERWVGGFLTNFEEIGKNIKKLKDFKDQKEKGLLAKYTKKEQLLIDRDIIKLEGIYEGVLDMPVLPDAVFIVDTVTEETAVKECVRMNIKVVAIADTNSDPQPIDYPIPGNDDAIKSVKILTDAIAKNYAEGKKELGKTQIAEAAEAEKTAAKKVKEDEEIAEALKVEVAAAEEQVEKAVVADFERK